MNEKYEKEILAVVHAARKLTKMLSHTSAHRLLVDVNSLNKAMPRNDALEAYQELQNRVLDLDREIEFDNLNIK